MKRLRDMDEGELDALLKRVGKLVERVLPPGYLLGKAGFVLILADAAPGTELPSIVQYSSNIPRSDAVDLLHEVGDYIEDEIDAQQDAEGDDHPEDSGEDKEA